ncbi:MAG: response regulator [Thermoanaerobaculaceae bacterium]|nr:response regulator [Thermoanaerobaculaceae bacterium]
MKILIVDDEENILKMLKKALTNKANHIVITKTIEEAEFFIASGHFDVVISDIKLTGILGREGL